MENPFEIILGRLEHIEKLLENNLENTNKNHRNTATIMTIKDVSDYLNLSIPTIYGYTAKRYIPHAKRGNRLFFNKKDIDKWIIEGEQNTISDIERTASDYLVKNQMKCQ